MSDKKPSVYAVLQATIEIYVQPSSPQETFEQMHHAASREAESTFREAFERLRVGGTRIGVVGEVRFSHAVIK